MRRYAVSAWQPVVRSSRFHLAAPRIASNAKEFMRGALDTIGSAFQARVAAALHRRPPSKAARRPPCRRFRETSARRPAWIGCWVTTKSSSKACVPSPVSRPAPTPRRTPASRAFAPGIRSGSDEVGSTVGHCPRAGHRRSPQTEPVGRAWSAAVARAPIRPDRAAACHGYGTLRPGHRRGRPVIGRSP